MMKMPFTALLFRQTPRYRVWLRQLILFALVTGVIPLVVGLLLYIIEPLMSLPQLLWQARFGLLAWRICLYVACGALWLSLYRRQPAQRPAMKRVAVVFVALLVLNETSNLLQWGKGV